MNRLRTCATLLAAAAASVGWAGSAGAADAASSYPVMAPLGAYLMPDRAAEIALARSAAPPAVARDAGILVLTRQGYVTAVPGRNGFICLVERAWFSGLTDGGFWNPKLRGPDCYNREAARSVLPTYLLRTRWALAGATQRDIRTRTRAAMVARRIHAPEIGSMNYMLSKGGYLGDGPHGPWHPHLMFYMPPIPTADWGAGQPGTPVHGADAGIDPYTMFYITVARWSDGSADDHAGG